MHTDRVRITPDDEPRLRERDPERPGPLPPPPVDDPLVRIDDDPLRPPPDRDPALLTMPALNPARRRLTRLADIVRAVHGAYRALATHEHRTRLGFTTVQPSEVSSRSVLVASIPPGTRHTYAGPVAPSAPAPALTLSGDEMSRLVLALHAAATGTGLMAQKLRDHHHAVSGYARVSLDEAFRMGGRFLIGNSVMTALGTLEPTAITPPLTLGEMFPGIVAQGGPLPADAAQILAAVEAGLPALEAVLLPLEAAAAEFATHTHSLAFGLVPMNGFTADTRVPVPLDPDAFHPMATAPAT